VTRVVGAALVALSLCCGKLPTTSDGVAFLQVQLPSTTTLNIGDTLRLHAAALDRQGNPLEVAISWRTADSTVTVGASTGLITAISPGPGRVQAVIGADALVSDFITLTVKDTAAALRHE
jgi:uncharacterized protein YjdB